MSERLLYFPLECEPYVRVEKVHIPDGYSFDTACQKQECIRYLHNHFHKLYEGEILEISTKSSQMEGVQLSAFNLCLYVNGEGRAYPVENIYQSSKVFENGRNYRDLLYTTPKDAKKDERLVNSGKVIKYIYEDFKDGFDEVVYLANPKEIFFDYIYMSALIENEQLYKELFKYEAFTDIEFDPVVGTNCQAKTAAKFVGKFRAGIIRKRSDVCDMISGYVIRR